MYKVDNAIILAAGASSRFAPLSYEIPKGLVEVNGEILVERLIEQFLDKGIEEIILVVGYKKEQYYYLEEKYGVIIIDNEEYEIRNNNSSIYLIRDYLKNSYICPVDNYYIENPFNTEEEMSFYSSMYHKGYTDEWIINFDENDFIKGVTISGKDAWYMSGYVFWDEEFSKTFIEILNEIYEDEETYSKFWEDIYLENLDKLDMKIKRFDTVFMKEFDSLNDLREYDKTYINNTRSKILENISRELNCEQKDLNNFVATKDGNIADGFYFLFDNEQYHYDYKTEKIIKTGEKND